MGLVGQAPANVAVPSPSAADVARRRANVVNRSRVEAPVDLASLSVMYNNGEEEEKKEEEKKEEEPLPRHQSLPQQAPIQHTRAMRPSQPNPQQLGTLLVTFIPNSFLVTGDLNQLNRGQQQRVVMLAPAGVT
jgi:hypothetical protein